MRNTLATLRVITKPDFENKELLKPKPKEPLPTVEPVNNEYIEHLKNSYHRKSGIETVPKYPRTAGNDHQAVE